MTTTNPALSPIIKAFEAHHEILRELEGSPHLLNKSREALTKLRALLHSESQPSAPLPQPEQKEWVPRVGDFVVLEDYLGKFKVHGIDGEWFDVRSESFNASARLHDLNPWPEFASDFARPPYPHVLHNPDNLTPEQVGEGYRLLLKDEVDGKERKNCDWWNPKKQCWREARGNDTWMCDASDTIRLPLSTPWPDPPQPETSQEKWVREKAAFARGEKLEFLHVRNTQWLPFHGRNPSWDSLNVKWRIKEVPTPPVAGSAGFEEWAQSKGLSGADSTGIYKAVREAWQAAIAFAQKTEGVEVQQFPYCEHCGSSAWFCTVCQSRSQDRDEEMERLRARAEAAESRAESLGKELEEAKAKLVEAEHEAHCNGEAIMGIRESLQTVGVGAAFAIDLGELAAKEITSLREKLATAERERDAALWNKEQAINREAEMIAATQKAELERDSAKANINQLTREVDRLKRERDEAKEELATSLSDQEYALRASDDARSKAMTEAHDLRQQLAAAGSGWPNIQFIEDAFFNYDSDGSESTVEEHNAKRAKWAMFKRDLLERMALGAVQSENLPPSPVKGGEGRA